MALQPFTWGAGGQKITSPKQAEQQRRIAEALAKGTPAKNWAEGLANATGAWAGQAIEDRVAQAEAEGQQRAGGLFANLAMNSSPDAVLQALSSPDAAWASDAQTSIASALLNQGMERSDPMYQMNLEKAQLELEALRAPAPSLPYDPNAPSSFQEWQLAQAYPGYTPDDGSLVTVNTGENGGAFLKKADELAAARLDTIVTEGNGAQTLMGDINTLTALGTQINTGKTAEVMNALGPYAEALGVNIEGLGETQAYQSIIDRMAPAMRPAGSGASSDFDAKQFLRSLPALGNTPEGNQIITETMSALQQHKIRAAEIASEAFAGQKTWQQAEGEIRALGDPYQRFNEYRRRSGVNVQNGQVTSAPSGITIRRID